MTTLDEEEEEKKKIVEDYSSDDSEEEFEKSRKIRQIVNEIVMESFIEKPLLSVAKSFSKESGCDCFVEYAENQQEIKRLIMGKQFDEAIKFLDDLGVNSDSHSSLFFELEKNKLIDLLENQRLEEAISFFEHFLRWEKSMFQEDCREASRLFMDAHEVDLSITSQVLKDTQISNVAMLASNALREHYRHNSDLLLLKVKSYCI